MIFNFMYVCKLQDLLMYILDPKILLEIEPQTQSTRSICRHQNGFLSLDFRLKKRIVHYTFSFHG